MKTEATPSIPSPSDEHPPVRWAARDFVVGARDWSRSFVSSAYLPWAIVAIGVLVRVVRYAADRPLWLDEAYLVLNLKSRSYGHLLETLDFNQAAPPGFLVIEKAALGVLGDSEYALRLLPFLAGIASMILAYPVARRYLSRRGVPVALLFFALLEPFTFFATEVKQYSIDILVTLLLLYVFARTLDARPRNRARWIVAMAALGTAIVWLSYPSVFVLAGTGGALLIVALRRRDRGSIVWVIVSFGLILVAFVLAFVLSIHQSRAVQESAGLVTSSSHSVFKNLYLIFADPTELPRTVVGFAAVLTFVGFVSILRRRADQALMMVLAVGSVLIAGLAGQYPIGQRFLAFLLPLLALGLGEGIAALARLPSPLTTAVTIGAAALVLAPPAINAARRVAHPPRGEQITSLLEYIDGNWQTGDTLYVSAGAQYAFRYYLECSDCSGGPRFVERRRWKFVPRAGTAQDAPALASRTRALVVGTSLQDATDVPRLRGRARVWVLFTHYWPYELRTLTEPFNRLGTLLDAKRDGGSAVYLYDLHR